MSKNIIKIFKENVIKSPNKIALITKDKSYTYKQLEEDILNTTLNFKNKGIKSNSHCIVILDSSYEFIVTMMTLANIGAVLVPLSTTLKINAIEQAISTTNSNFLISNSILCKKLNLNIEKLDINNLKHYDITQQYLNREEVSSSNDFILTMTSGSTGDPKPIVFTQQTKIDRSIMAAKDLYNLDENEVIIAASPLYHSMGQRLVLLPILIGATSVVLDKFHPKRWLEYIEKYNITFTIAISSHLEQLVKYIDKEYNLTSLKSIVSSSSLLKDNIKKECIDKFKCDFYECYGTSEVGIVTNLAPKDCNNSISSVGIALDFVDIKIVDDNKQEVKNGVVGEIIVKSETSFSRYYNNQQKTKESVIDGYFYTSDLGYMDSKGYLYLSGRKRDMVIVGGTNVYPVDIEAIISQVNGVKECSVIGIDDDYFGEVILAVLVVDDESLFNINTIKMACIKNLADYQQPMAYEIVQELPKNELDKIMKHKLKEQFSCYDATKYLREILR